MRSEERRSKRHTGKSRARILLKKSAGWLPGFPSGIESDTAGWQAWPWESPGTSRVVSLDREALRRLEMTLTKLRHHFPRALPQIVEDVDDWLARMDCLLDVLKAAVHQQRLMDVETLLAAASCLSARWVQRFRQIRAARPELAPLLDAVAFLEFTGRSRCDTSAMEWIDEHATTLAQLAEEGGALRDLQLTFVTLRKDIHANTLPLLLNLMTDASFCSLPSADIDAYAYARQLSRELNRAAERKQFKIPEKPPRTTMGEVWRNLLGRLLDSKAKARQHATELLGLLLPEDFAARARSLGMQVEDEQSRLVKRLHQIRFEGLPKQWKRVDKKKLKEQSKVVVLDSDTFRLLEHTSFVLNHMPTIIDQGPHVRQWIRFVDCLSTDERSLRLGIFARWEQARLQRRDPDQANRQFHQLVSELCQLFARRGVHQTLLQHWRKDVQSNKRYFSDPVNSLLDSDYGGRETYRRWIRLLQATVYDRNLSMGPELLNSLEEFVQATSDIDRASQLIAALAEVEDAYFCEREIRATFAVSNHESNLAEILQKLDEDYALVAPVTLLGRHIQDERLRRVVERWVIGGAKKSLLRLATCTQFVVDLGFSVPQIRQLQSPSAWLTAYPSQLHGPLKALQQVTPDAKAVAAALLDKDFPDPADLQRQLDAVRGKLASAEDPQGHPSRQRLQKRLVNLQSRIHQPPAVTPQRLENLAKKIENRVDHEIVDHYVQDCFAIAAEKMQATYGVGQVPEELFAPPKDQLLAAIFQLQGVMKELGLRLLFKIQHDPKCDFRAEPRNAVFLKTLQAKEIRLDPWLSESFERTATTASGEPYRLAFTREILDVLLMGFHFDTCLSPGAFNFFSTIANAVDINKQVLYGKTESGRIVGRCLFALADNGTLLTYHRYAHDAADGFEKQVNQFAEQLAKAMNTALASSGQVSTLVARSWYDDGAVSNESIYDLQNPEGRVRTILRTEDVSQIAHKLLEFFSSEEALKTVLGSLLSLDEFQQRREIIEPLLDLFGFDATVPMLERFRLAMLARLAGRSEAAREIVRALRVNSLPRRLKRFECCHCAAFHGIGSYGEVFDLLIDCNPSIALRLIRVTRPKNVKSDAEETHPVRKSTLRRCHQLLGRDRVTAE